MAKRLHSAYLPGKRTRSWLKGKHYQRERFLVGGYLPDRDQVRSVLVGLPGPGPTTPLRCSSVPSWPWRSASSAGSRAGCATLPTAA